MNYQKINAALIANDYYKLQSKSGEAFLNYLVSNNVAYSYVSQKKAALSASEEKIIEVGKMYSQKYLKTLRLLTLICAENKIDFSLFKTHKHIPEVVDGDIDCIVHKKDFSRFVDSIRSAGFETVLEDTYKGVCTKEGFCKVEPRANVTFHSLEVFGEEKIWEFTQDIKIEEFTTKTTSLEFDTVCLLLNTLYGPKYVSIYLYKLLQISSKNEIAEILANTAYNIDMLFIIDQLENLPDLNYKFPYFYQNAQFSSWWLKRVMPIESFSFFTKLRILVFFYYCKYKYNFFNKLHFAHTWI